MNSDIIFTAKVVILLTKYFKFVYTINNVKQMDI